MASSKVGHLTIILSILALSGCGIGAKIDARNDMQQSKLNYKNCLANNPSGPKACESTRLAYEADIRAYKTLSAGMQPGLNSTLNVTTSSDQ
jgi:hypothetical protein